MIGVDLPGDIWSEINHFRDFAAGTLRMRAYKYLFYTFFRFYRRSWVTMSPELSAFILIVIVTWWSLLALVMIAECILRVPLLPDLTKWQVGFVLAGLVVPLYFLFLHRGAAKRIAAEFKGESPSQARFHAGLAVAYCVTSFALSVVMAMIRAKVLPRL